MLDPGTVAAETPESIICRDLKSAQTVTIKEAGIYQVDVHLAKMAKPAEITLHLGDRQFTATPNQPAFIVVRLPSCQLPLSISGMTPERIVFTPLAAEHELAKRFAAFEKRLPFHSLPTATSARSPKHGTCSINLVPMG